jgi:membrane protein DedA with SNARE-associated domain
MQPLPFVLYSAAGTVLWTTALAYAGRLLGGNYEKVGRYLDPVVWLLLSAFLVAYVVRLVRWRRSEG